MTSAHQGGIVLTKVGRMDRRFATTAVAWTAFGRWKEAWQASRTPRRHLAARRIALAWRAWWEQHLRHQAAQRIAKALLDFRSRALIRRIRAEAAQLPQGGYPLATLLAPPTLAGENSDEDTSGWTPPPLQPLEDFFSDTSGWTESSDEE